MLKLIDIKKDYKVADTKVNALKGVSFCFRKNEFVSILGPSGCGKTTLLNIIGGLDKYTSGDLVILGRSTKEFKDADWDVYRNRSIGFVFQSYNLIPHQTVLGNVELALTISGLSKAQRVERAKAALDKVGLSDQYNKKPNQLSGGQCQRVAIARALVNDPEIILADEPTGALDTKTSKQIMELIKEVAKDHLVIMVTHNPQLAEEYSTRIIKLLDGELLEDSKPFSEEDEQKEVDAELAKKENEEKARAEALATEGKKTVKKRDKAKMSFFTAFRLSIQNLFSKKSRTTMTSIAGSIGIIGVSLVLSASFGLQGYLNKMQNDMLSGNPIEIRRTAFDINSISGSLGFGDQVEIASKNDWVDVKSMIDELLERMDSMKDMMVQNTITDDYVQYIKDMDQNLLSATMFDYGIDVSNSIYTDFNVRDGNSKVTSLSGIRAMYSSILTEMEDFAQYAPLIDQVAASFAQLPDTRDNKTEQYVMSQYDIIHKAANSNGIAKQANEVMIVLDKDRTLTDLLLAQLGYYTQDEFVNQINKVSDNAYDEDMYEASQKIEYEALIGKTFTWYENDNIFKDAPAADAPIMADDVMNMNNGTVKYLVDSPEGDGFEFKIVGIVEPKEDLSYGMLSSGFYYTTAFAEYAIEENKNSFLVDYVNNSKGTAQNMRMFTPKGTPIEAGGTTPMSVAMYTGITYKYSYSSTRKDIIAKGTGYAVADEVTFTIDSKDYIATINEINELTGAVTKFTFEDELPATLPPGQYSAVDGNGSGFKIEIGKLKSAFGVVGSSSDMLALLSMFRPSTSTDDSDEATGPEYSIATYSLQQAGGNKLPSAIAIYPVNFEQKEHVLAYLDAWNGDGDIEVNGKVLKGGVPVEEGGREKITYTDMLSLVIGILKTLLDVITWVLVGFTSLALVVSSVMIGIITYVSVVERIKEIGVIRSLGGRKRDVSNLFIAETVILGFVAGMIGVSVTYLLSWIINIVVGSLTIVSTIAVFPIWVAAIMLGISILLTSVSGLMPAISAAKKDPVVALRTE